jgi:hypothetical protein
VRFGADEADGTGAIDLSDAVESRITGHPTPNDQVLVVCHYSLPIFIRHPCKLDQLS